MMKETQFKAGMYLLETLTSGMYNDPLSIYREYIQNAVDSIDQSSQMRKDAEIKIELNPFKQSVVIYDNGVGIPSKKAEKILSSIGSSEKLGTQQRGFRGIGRLGGIAFAKKVVFRTTAAGESVISTQEWDCDGLRNLLNSPDHSSMSIEELFTNVSSFSQESCEELKNKSFFEVKLVEVECFQNYIFDIQKIKKYLAQVAPLPFDAEQFSFHDEVRNFLSTNIPQYGEYKIFVNNEQIFRPHQDNLMVMSKHRSDSLESVKLFSLNSENRTLAYGWYGCRRDFLGSISKGAAVSGLRVKVGNLQVGDQHLLDHCFRENRFNSYLVGEIHVCDQSLLPNSRRDDFVDNKAKAVFYNLIERELGLPLSKEIRHRSRTKTQPSEQQSNRKSAVSSSTIKSLGSIVEQSASADVPSVMLETLFKKCGDCQKLQQIIADNMN